MQREIKRHVFIVGSKGIPGAYGGYETFVDKLTQFHENEEIQYHVACKGKEAGEFEYHNAHCFKIRVPQIGPAQAIYYDVAALNYSCKYISENKIKNPVVYILACRIGPFARHFQNKIHKLGGTVYVNPDGHEWMRAKWSRPVRWYWKKSEQLMTKYADLLVCDSKNIEKYIHTEYSRFNPNTTYIAYGAETVKYCIEENDIKFVEWGQKHEVKADMYYLVVGRFVPENNYEIMLREFIKSNTNKSFVLVTNVSDKFLDKLRTKTGFDKDPRIKFVGTVYDQELLLSIRKNAYAYFHGHEVGGTNPSLLEALGATKLNLLLDVGFNRECGEDGAIYWTKEPDNLMNVIEMVDKMNKDVIEQMGKKAHAIVEEKYSWEYISGLYKMVFVNKLNKME